MSYLIGAANHIGIGTALWDEDRSILWESQNAFTYHMRFGQTNRGSLGFFELWSLPSMSGGNPSAPLCVLGGDYGTARAWAQWSVVDSGKDFVSLISGQCVDINSNPQVGVTVRAFRTSDNLFVNSTVTDSNGNFSVGSPYAVAHYVVAYEPGSPDSGGVSLNNIVPS